MKPILNAQYNLSKMKSMADKNPHAKAVRTPQYKMRVVKDKKQKAKRKRPSKKELSNGNESK